MTSRSRLTPRQRQVLKRIHATCETDDACPGGDLVPYSVADALVRKEMVIRLSHADGSRRIEYMMLEAGYNALGIKLDESPFP